MASLRYELIGDASSFSSAAQEVIKGAQQIEGSLEGLEGNIEAVTEGQLRYNEATERFMNTSGDFVSGAEAQARVLQELNSEGVQTTQQIREQVERLERLEAIYEDDAKASAELSNRQQRLRTQLAEVGAAAAQQNQDLTRLDQEFGQATVAMTDFASRQERLQQELRATAAAQSRVASSGVTMRSSVRASANNLGFEFVQAAQDARFGAAGVANQIPLMFEQFDQLQSKTGSTVGALRALSGSLLGTAGIVGAITIGLPLLEDFVSGMGDAEDSANDFDESVSSAADSVFELADASREGLTLTQQFGRSTISTLETTISQLESQLSRLRDRDPIRPGIGAPAPGFVTVESFAPQEELDRISEARDINEEVVTTVREQIQQRRINQRLLESQVDAIMEASTLSEDQAEALQDQSASLTTITSALQQGVIPQEQATQLAESRLDATNAIGASQSVINQLVSEEVVAFTDVLDAAESTKRQRQLINQAVDAGLVSQERANALIEEYKNDTSEAADNAFDIAEAIGEAQGEGTALESKFADLATRQGITLAQARRTKEQYEAQVEALRNVNRIMARRRDGIQAQQVMPAGIDGAVQRPQVLQDIQALSGQANVLEQYARRLEEARIQAEGLAKALAEAELAGSNLELGRDSQQGQDEANENQMELNNKIARSIQLSAQLGATIAQAARQGETEWNRLLGSILSTIGSVVALIPGGQIPGAAIAGTGQIIGAFQHGGQVRGPGTTMSDSIPAMLSDREFVVNAASAQQVLPLLEMINEGPAQAEKVRQAAAQMPPGTMEFADGGMVGGATSSFQPQVHERPPREITITQNIETEVRRLNNREIGLVVREDNSRRAQYGYDT